MNNPYETHPDRTCTNPQPVDKYVFTGKERIVHRADLPEKIWSVFEKALQTVDLNER